MLSVVGWHMLPESETVVGLNVGLGEVTIEGDVLWVGVMVALYPSVGLLGQNFTLISPVPPAVTVGLTAVAEMVKSVTFTVCDELLLGCPDTVVRNAPPVTLATPETEKVGWVKVAMDVVTSTSTVAVEPAASDVILHGTVSWVVPTIAALQFPVPPVIIAVGAEESPELGAEA